MRTNYPGFSCRDSLSLWNRRHLGTVDHRLMDCLTKLGRDVQIAVKATPGSRKNGRLSIVFA